MVRNKYLSGCVALLAAVGMAAPGFAQSGEQDVLDQIEELRQGQQAIQREIELEKEIAALKAEHATIQKQLEEIKKLVQARPAAAAPAARPSAGGRVAGVVFDIGDNPTKGADTSKLTLVEFTDYQ